MQRRYSTDSTTTGERLLLLLATLPIAALSLGALLVPEQSAHLAGATGANPYIYWLAGAAALAAGDHRLAGVIHERCGP